MKNNKNEFNEKDLEELRELLFSYDANIQMPEHLRGQHLLEQLPPEEPKKKFSLVEWLTSKKAIPVYSLVVACALLIVVIPRINPPVDNLTMGDAEVSFYEAAEMKEPEAAMEASDEMMDEMVVEAESDVETTVSAADTPMITEKTEKMAPNKEEAVVENHVVSSMPKKDTVKNIVPIPPKGPSSNSGPKTGGGAAMTPPKSVKDELSEPQESPMRAVGGGGKANYIGEQEGYDFFWRPVDPTDPDYAGAAIVLEVIAGDDNALYVQQPLENIFQVISVFEANDRLYVIGVGETGTELQIFHGLAEKSLELETTMLLYGNYLDIFSVKEDYYILTILSKENNTSISDVITLPNAAEDGAFIVTTVKNNTPGASQTAIQGVSGSSSYTQSDDVLTIFYTTDDGDTEQSMFSLKDGTLIISEKNK